MSLEGLPKHTVVEGPEALTAALNQLWQACQNSPVLASEDHYLLYQRGKQQSVLKVDVQQKPFQFWYCDRDGRPMPRSITQALATFAWENGVNKDNYQHNYQQFESALDTIVHDISKAHLHEVHEPFLKEVVVDRMEILPEDLSLPHAFDQVRQAIAHNAGIQPSIANSRFGLFQPPKEPAVASVPEVADRPKPGSSK